MRSIESEKITGRGRADRMDELLRAMDAGGHDTSSRTMFMVGGSAAPPAMMHAFQERHGIQIVHGWG